MVIQFKEQVDNGQRNIEQLKELDKKIESLFLNNIFRNCLSFQKKLKKLIDKRTILQKRITKN